MIGGQASFILLSTLAVIQNSNASQISVTEAEFGDNVTLICKHPEHESGLFYWFKIKCGSMFETVAHGTFSTPSLQGQFNNSRFNIKKVGNAYFFTIRNLSKEDEAMYFCQAGASYNMPIVNGTYLAVNDPHNKQKTVHVKQSSHVERVPLGHSVTLQCSFLTENKESPQHCPDEGRVFWYRSGSKSDPSIIYTDSSSCDKQAGGRCVSHLSKTIHDASYAGNYYCAVVTCGEILFGEGTKVEIRQEYLLVTVLGTLLACSVLVNVVLIITRRNQKPTCKGKLVGSIGAEQSEPAVDQPSNMDAEGINYVALDFPSRKAKRQNNKQESSGHCTYSSTRYYQ